mmetsp:Transcript_30852/g.91790  ORF Transcript_30852/g.91790 Transcript_30852/m.91790 type:complete len:215 (-) Transcript_30852:271-915(-)
MNGASHACTTQRLGWPVYCDGRASKSLHAAFLVYGSSNAETTSRVLGGAAPSALADTNSASDSSVSHRRLTPADAARMQRRHAAGSDSNSPLRVGDERHATAPGPRQPLADMPPRRRPPPRARATKRRRIERWRYRVATLSEKVLQARRGVLPPCRFPNSSDGKPQSTRPSGSNSQRAGAATRAAVGTPRTGTARPGAGCSSSDSTLKPLATRK